MTFHIYRYHLCLRGTSVSSLMSDKGRVPKIFSGWYHLMPRVVWPNSITYDLMIWEPTFTIVFVVQWHMCVEFVVCKAKCSQNIEQKSLGQKSRVFWHFNLCSCDLATKKVIYMSSIWGINVHNLIMLMSVKQRS